MATEVAPVDAARAERSPGSVVARLTSRKAIRSGVLWGYIFGVFVASSAISYVTIYKTQTSRNHLEAAFGANTAASALFGPGLQLQTVAGFTVFKTSMTLMILGAVWGLLTSTRLLRGEEDAGRWEILLAGQTTPARATLQALAGLAGGVATLWAITAVITTIAGLSSRVRISAGPALYLALALVASALMWLGVGAFTSQLAATRRQAAAYAAAVLGVSYAIRMVADSGIGLHWLLWASPLGWVEELQPLTSPRPLALVPVFAFTAALSAGAVHLAGARDLGASTLPDRSSARPHLRLLSGQVALTTRLVRSTVVGWGVAIAITGLLVGLVAKSAGATISGSSVHQVFSRLGARGTGTAAYLGVCELIVAVLIAFVAGGQVTAARGEEAAGRLDHLLVRPVSRAGWFGGRCLTAALALALCGVLSGVFTWLGAASEHAGLGVGTLIGAGFNAVAPALCLLGIGMFAIGLWPRATSAITYGVLAWSLLIEIVGGIGAVNHWVLDTSLFHQMSAAPAVPPDWTTAAVMALVGIAFATTGATAFQIRDLKGE
ncbi:MAG: hypothetical protein ACLPQS_04365 [Acidimicrobiales bacterium]